MFIYLLSLPVWNFVLPTYAFWKFDDFSWGDTRKTAGEKSSKGGHGEAEGEFDSSMITMKRWAEFERDRRVRNTYWAGSRDNVISGVGGSNGWGSSQPRGHEQGRHFDDYFSDA